jgi:hypothetical protein
MLQHNLIFGIQQKIKEGRAQAESGKMTLEENSIESMDSTSKKEVEIILEGSLNTGIYQQTHASQKKAASKKRLVTESFNMSKAQKKLDKDIVFFNYLYENYTEESMKANFSILLESILGDTIRLYQEADVTPRLLSPTLDSNEITESITEDIYRNSLNESIKNNYTKPMLSGKINELYESQMRDLTKKLIQEGSDLDMEQVRVYLPFEESVYNFIKEVVIPKTAASRIEAFMESTDAEYTDLLEESVQDILSKLEQKIKLMSSLISPNMFDKAVEQEGVDAPKMAGITITVDKNFNGDGDGDADDICPAAAAAMDPEISEEIESEDEAEAIEDEEAEEAEEAGAVETPEEEAEEEAKHGAEEMQLPMEDGTPDPANGMVTNDHDVSLSGNGYDNGTLDNPLAELPTSVVPDDIDDKIEDMMSDDVSEEMPDLENEDDKDLIESKK